MITIAEKEFETYLIDNNDDFQWQQLLYELSLDHKDIVIDLETTGLSCYLGDRIAGIALYLPMLNKAYYLSFRHAEGNNLPIEYMEELRHYLTRSDVNYIGHNLNFDLSFLLHEGFNIYDMGSIEDTMIMLHILDENRRDHGMNYKLKDVSRQFVDANAANSDDELKEKLALRGIKKGQMYQLPANEVAAYACTDVILTWLLREFLNPFIDKWLVRDLFKELNSFLQLVILRLQSNGMLVSRDLCYSRINSLEMESKELLSTIRKIAGFEINPSSPQQVSQWLGISNAQAKTLEEIAQRGDERAELILKYKTATKADTTFFIPYLELSKGDGKVHSTFHVTGTVTGRLSSSEPNLQQVPRKSSYDIKKVFIAPDGYKIVQCDYKAQELRLAAYYASEPQMIEMLSNGFDAHEYTGNKLGITRQLGKNMNFGLLYGMGFDRASDYLKITLDEATKLVTEWRNLYPRFRQTLYNYFELAQQPRNPDGSPNGKYGFVRLDDGRCRHYNFDGKEYTAWNFKIQGTGSSVMRKALTKVCKAFPTNDVVVPVATVHDSAIFYVKDDDQFNQTCATIKSGMESVWNHKPPMEIEIQVGDNWYDLEEYKL